MLKKVVHDNANPQTPEELRKISVTLLHVYTIVCDERRLIHEEVTEISQAEFELQMKMLGTKGYAYDERVLWRRLGEPEQVKTWRKDIEEISLILEGCKNIERQLNLVKETFRLEAKLSYEGH
jgi:2'-5' RNA ligase